MRRILLMVAKDLKRQIRAPLAMLGVLAFPIVFALLLALTFGSGGPRAPRVKLLVADGDDSLLSGFLLSAAGNEQLAEFFDVVPVDPVEGRARIEKGEASALLRIPTGFQSDLLAGETVTLELVRNPAQNIKPEIAEQAMIVLADVLSAAARILEGPLATLADCMASTECELNQADVMGLAGELYLTLEASEPLLMPPAITLKSVDLEGDGGSSSGSIFLFVFPGISVWALFMLGDMAMRDILSESVAGTLRRQLTCPITSGQVVLAKALLTFVVAAISLTILAVVGAVALDRSVDLAGFAVLSLALILAVTGYAAVVYGAARTERQGATMSSILILFFAFVGGSFIQVDSLPTVVQRLAPVSPFYWGTQGFRALIRDAAGIADLLPHLAILSGVGLVLLWLGAGLLGRSVRRGVAA